MATFSSFFAIVKHRFGKPPLCQELLYRVVHKFCNNISTVKLSAMKANISHFKHTIRKSRQFCMILM